MRSFRNILNLAILLSFFAALCVVAQQPAPTEEKKNPVLSPSARLSSAKTVFVRDAGGASVAYKVITSDIEGWGRLALVNSADKADLVIELTASGVARGGGLSISSTTTQNGPIGRPENSTKTTKELSSGPLRMVVRDSRSTSALWSATEQVRSAMRQKTQEDAVVAAAEVLFKKFHDSIEPPSKE